MAGDRSSGKMGPGMMDEAFRRTCAGPNCGKCGTGNVNLSLESGMRLQG